MKQFYKAIVNICFLLNILETNQSNGVTVPTNPPSIYHTVARNQRELQSITVLPLLLRKSTTFHDKKTLDLKKALDDKYMTNLSNYKKIAVVFKNRRAFTDDEHYIFICLPQTRWSIEHTVRKRLFFHTLKSFNMSWSATPLHMVNYHIGEKDQPHIHAIALDKFLVLWNAKIRQMGKWHVCFMSFNMATSATHCKPETKKTVDSNNACLCTGHWNFWQMTTVTSQRFTLNSDLYALV